MGYINRGTRCGSALGSHLSSGDGEVNLDGDTTARHVHADRGRGSGSVQGQSSELNSTGQSGVGVAKAANISVGSLRLYIFYFSSSEHILQCMKELAAACSQIKECGWLLITESRAP